MVPRKVGTAWEVLTPAKLNLYLEVLGKRADGFHELETLMVPVRIYDELRWTPAVPRQEPMGCSLSIGNAGPTDNQVPSDDQNLVLKAAKLLAARAGTEAYGHFHLTKRIPTQAGMGGGSSDAAATLILANESWGLGFTRPVLSKLGEELGSDVPFFLNSGPAVCRGRGELVEPVDGLPRLHFVVGKPSFGLSTADIFHNLTEVGPISARKNQDSAAQVERLLMELRLGSIGRACRWMINRLEEAATRLSPQILRVKATLARAGCWGQFLTGSGSAVVGIARSAIHARRIARMLSAQDYGTVLATASAW